MSEVEARGDGNTRPICQKSFSDADGLDSAAGVSADASCCAGCDPSGGGESGRLSMPTCPGEGVLLTPSEIFSFRARSLVTSASNAASRCWSWRFVFSKVTMCVVASEPIVMSVGAHAAVKTDRAHLAPEAKLYCSSDSRLAVRP